MLHTTKYRSPPSRADRGWGTDSSPRNGGEPNGRSEEGQDVSTEFSEEERGWRGRSRGGGGGADHPADDGERGGWRPPGGGCERAPDGVRQGRLARDRRRHVGHEGIRREGQRARLAPLDVHDWVSLHVVPLRAADDFDGSSRVHNAPLSVRRASGSLE